jgi:PPOX class probable F420-dependent enzyme
MDADEKLPTNVHRFLSQPRFATIGTIGPNGTPHQAMAWYLLRDDSIILNSKPDRVWPRNLLRDPRISVMVSEHDRSHWVGIKGAVEVVRQGVEAAEEIMEMARWYGGNPEAFRGQNRITFRVRPTWTHEHGT